MQVYITHATPFGSCGRLVDAKDSLQTELKTFNKTQLVKKGFYSLITSNNKYHIIPGNNQPSPVTKRKQNDLKRRALDQLLYPACNQTIESNFQAQKTVLFSITYGVAAKECEGCQ